MLVNMLSFMISYHTYKQSYTNESFFLHINLLILHIVRYSNNVNQAKVFTEIIDNTMYTSIPVPGDADLFLL